MAVRKTNGKNSAGAGKNAAAVEQKVVALAEQLGWFLGTARAKADGWLESDKVRTEIARIRDGATDLLQHIDAASRAARLNAGKPKAVPDAQPIAVARPSRGPVDAPGKRHRKPTPNVKIDKRMGEPEGKHMGQKNFKMGTGKRRISG